MKIKVKYITRGAVVAALYAACSLLLAPLSYGVVQLRLAEALVMLPVIMPESVIGVFVGCAVANMFSPVGVFDVLLGSLVTLVAAVATRLMRKNVWLASLPPILLNTFIMPLVWLYFGNETGYVMNAVSIFLSETAVVLIGALAVRKLQKNKAFMEKLK